MTEKLTKREKILKLRAAELTFQTVIDDLVEDLDEVEGMLRELGETPQSEIGEVEADEAEL